MGNGVQGYGVYGQWGTGGMGHIGNGSHGQWGTGVWGIWAMRPTGGIVYRGMGHMGNRGTRGMGYMGNRVQEYEPHGERGAHGRFAPKISKRCQVVKKMSSCQKDVKCQKMKHLDYGGGSQKN